MAGNQKIVRADWRSCCFQFETKHAGSASGIRSERYLFNNIQQDLHLLRFAARLPRAGSAGEKFETGYCGDPAIIRRQCTQFFDNCRHVAQQINARVGIQQVFHANAISEFGRWGKAALIQAPESAVGDPYLLKKIPRPTPFRFWLDDYCLAFLPNEHFRSIEPVVLWQSDGLRTSGRKQLGCVHVDTVSTLIAPSNCPSIGEQRTASVDLPKAKTSGTYLTTNGHE